MKRVLFILHLPPPIHGAATVGKYIQQSKIINTSFVTDFINLSTAKTLEDIGINSRGKLGNLFCIFKSVFKALSNNKYDLCYMTLTSNGIGFYKDFIIVILLKLFRKKIVYHFHNKGVFEKQSNFLNHILYKIVFKNTSSILLSNHLYYDIERYVAQEDVFYCFNGIPKGGSYLCYSEKNQTNKPFSILFLSNMMQQKGVFVILEACELLKKRNFSFECHFVGAWSDVTESVFNDYVSRLGINQYVFAHGKKYDNDKLKFFHEADIFVFPTFYHNETFGLVLLEAMQNSLPVITCPEGGISDVVSDGETGFLIPSKNALALADKIEIFIENPKLKKQMGIEGKKRYEEFFTLEKFENNLCGILKQVIEQ